MTTVKQYETKKQNFSNEEKALLKEIRENLVDMAISSETNFSINEENLLKDIRNFLNMKLDETPQYIENLSYDFLRNIVGYGTESTNLFMYITENTG